MQSDDPLAPSQLDLTSDPPTLGRSSPPNTKSSRIQRPAARQQVQLFFECCKVAANLTPPLHVLQGKSDIWRAHCPRCGGVTEILFE